MNITQNLPSGDRVANSIRVHEGVLTMVGTLAYSFAHRFQRAILQLRDASASTENRAYVFESDGTLRAAQSNERLAKRYLNSERILVVVQV
jgi:hypothetical protein